MPVNRNQIKAALQKPYNRILFSKEVLSPIFNSGFSIQANATKASVEPNKSESAVIAGVWIYGNIRLEDGTDVTCYEIQLQPNKRIEQNKVAVQHYVRKLLTVGQAALVNFISSSYPGTWRFTLIAKDSEIKDGGIKEKLTHAKRYTYLLGPSETCKTAAERFETLSKETLISFGALTTAFSVEKLSKAFFDEYTKHYLKFCNYLQDSSFRRSVFSISFPSGATQEEKDKASKPIRDFTKKLLGRIVFLYFVQKKGWLGATSVDYKDGKPDFLMRLFKESGGNKAFYNSWLSPLFFETLNNSKRAKENFTMPDGETVKVPYLNGGLFDREDYDEHILTFPSALFHNTENSEDPKDRGFFDFLDSFNFTVHEDSPDDQTVAVDPEMLGHIFENLLEDNKDKGTYYTPKEIVHYMCQESLIEYLATHLSKEYTVYRQLGNQQVELFGNDSRKGQLKMVEELGEKALSRDDVDYIVKYKNISQLTKEQLVRMGELLDSVKICDPAIGSGAFPMGLLQEIYGIKEVIAYVTKSEWKPAEVKENIIQNSVYGVDIEKGAVDIARLRFWLSLIVDEEKPRPLPNLDYKIVVGNSLISLFEDEVIEIDWEIKDGTQRDIFGNDNDLRRIELLNEITRKHKQYFHSENADKKKAGVEIRNLKIDILINQLELTIKTKGLDSKPSGNGKNIKAQTELYLQTQQWKTAVKKLVDLRKNKEKPLKHFDWKLDFPEILNPYLQGDENRRGFDIVIGNPPYIQLQKDGGNLAKLYEKCGYKTFERTGDIYSLFYEKGWQIQKPKGNLCYITSNKWMRAGYGESTRKFFAEYTDPLLLVDFAGQKIFENVTVDANILLFSRGENRGKTIAYTVKSKVLNQLSVFVKQALSICSYKSSKSWVILNPIEQKIKTKIEAAGTSLKEWDVRIYRGILTGYNEAFIIDGKKRAELIEQDSKSEEIIRPNNLHPIFAVHTIHSVYQSLLCFCYLVLFCILVSACIQQDTVFGIRFQHVRKLH